MSKKTNIIVAAFMAANPDNIRVTIDRKSNPPEASMSIPTEDGESVEVTMDEFDGMYRGFVRLWPVVKPAKTELLDLLRESTATEKAEKKEAAIAEKKATRAKEKAEREAEKAAEKKAKDEAREEAKAEREKKKADKLVAKEKAAKEKADAKVKAAKEKADRLAAKAKAAKEKAEAKAKVAKERAKAVKAKAAKSAK